MSESMGTVTGGLSGMFGSLLGAVSGMGDRPLGSLLGAVSGVGDRLLGWLLPMTVATGAILVAALLADRLLERRVSASLRLLLYGAVLARLALPAQWHNPFGLFGGRRAASVTVEDGAAVMVALTGQPAGTTLSPTLWVGLLYAVVVLGLLGRWLYVRLELRRRLKECRALTLDAPGVAVWRHEELGPFVAGLLRPRIVVPGALVDAPDREALAWVLRHEAAHVRRRDPLLGAFVQVACILAWPILPVWIAARRVRALVELACDEDALRGADRAARRRYGEVLLSLAEGTSTGQRLAGALPFGSPLHSRLRALVTWKRWPWPAQASVVAAVAAVVVACAAEPTPEELDGDASLDGPAQAIYRLAADEVLVQKAPSARLVVPSSSPAPKILPERLRLQDESLPREPALDTMYRLARRAAFMSPPRASDPEAGATGETPGMDPGPNRQPILTITKDGVLYLNRLQVEKKNLEEAIREKLRATGTDMLLLRGDRAAMMDLSTDYMGIAKRAGARNIGILTPRNPGLLSEESPGKGSAPESRRITKPQPPASDSQPPAASIRGSLDKEIIRGVIRQHILEVKDCYEAQLALNPTLGGRVMVQFTIAATGEVVASALANSTLGNAQVESCVVRAVRTWTFPKPEGGGVVIVTYPFAFTPSGSEEAAPSKPRPRAGGKMDPDEVAGVVRALLPEVKRCYERHLSQSRGGGRINFSWTIDRTGAVKNQRAIRDDLGDAKITSCIAEVLDKARFAPVSEEVEVQFPFVFQSGKP